MEIFNNLKFGTKLYCIYSTITILTMFLAIPLGVTHEMNPSWGIDIGLKNGYGWILFGMMDVFAIWTIFAILTNKTEENYKNLKHI